MTRKPTKKPRNSNDHSEKPPPEQHPPETRSATPEEVFLFHAAMGDVDPLPDSSGPPSESDSAFDSDTQSFEDMLDQPVKPARRSHKTKAKPADIRGQSPSSLAPLAHGATPGVDKRTAQRLKRGQLPVEARLDLHGMTQDESAPVLQRFIADAQSSGKRCVLIITGKGLKADGSVGVLREAVPRWLNEPPNRGRILSFSHATPDAGGTGALFVLLRRLR